LAYPGGRRSRLRSKGASPSAFINFIPMNRNKFLSVLGLSFLGTSLLSGKRIQKSSMVTDCEDPITPPVPEGPFYKEENLNRMDITEGKIGKSIEYLFVVEDKNCHPIKDAIVDIWQCDREGMYSDFASENSLSQKWLRGYQKTDALGECRFSSIFPGWYEGRITHIHAKVHIRNQTILTTNFFFPQAIEHEVHTSSLYPKGPNPLSVLKDVELRVDKDLSRHDTLIMKVAKDAQGGLHASYRMAIG
jgi:protocatechuate 3,4-dioxygenase beta subunit